METTDQRRPAQLLLRAGRLLLEYNESTGGVIDALTSTAKVLTNQRCQVAVTYRAIAVSLGEDGPLFETVTELRMNAAVLMRIHAVLDQVRRREIDAKTAVERLENVASDTPRHSRWLTAALLGAGGCSFARLLGADAVAVGTAGLATALGLFARQELGRRRASVLALPLFAALIGAIMGGIAIRLGWTASPEILLIVPALMIVPGPHLLNGLFDLVDNHVPMSLSRLGLALGILLSSALGIVLGVRLILPDFDLPEDPSHESPMNLILDMVLAGIAAGGFASFFNTPWRQLWLALLSGMAGHGVRYVALERGVPLDAATLLGGIVVGAVSAGMARWGRSHVPVAVIAFAGAVTMVPGTSFYRALGGALRLARESSAAGPELAATTLSRGVEGIVVVSGLALGLILGIRGVRWLAGRVVPK